MYIQVKATCPFCGKSITLNTNQLPSYGTPCWKCNAVLVITGARQSGATVKATRGTETKDVQRTEMLQYDV